MSHPPDPLPPPPWAEPPAEPPAESSEPQAASVSGSESPPAEAGSADASETGVAGEFRPLGADVGLEAAPTVSEPGGAYEPVSGLVDAPSGTAPTGPDGAQVADAPATATPTDSVVGPSFVFFGVLSALSLAMDVGSKAWAEIVLGKRTLIDPAIVLIEDHLSLTLAYNKGGAWGLLQSAGDNIRKPFFLLVSALAIAFIVSLYGRLAPGQRALKWGLPLVLGGALGNLSDRIVRSSVIDFIDYRADWVQSMNELIAKYLAPKWTITDHWPTFNVADISICIGVGLMAIDMLTSRRGAAAPAVAAVPLSEADTQAGPADAGLAGAGIDAVSLDPARARIEDLARAEGEETPTVPLPDVMPRLAQDLAPPPAEPTPTAQLPDVMPRVARDLAAAGQIPAARGTGQNVPAEETPTAELPPVAPKDTPSTEPGGEPSV